MNSNGSSDTMFILSFLLMEESKEEIQHPWDMFKYLFFC